VRDAKDDERHVCACRRDGEAAGSPPVYVGLQDPISLAKFLDDLPNEFQNFCSVRSALLKAIPVSLSQAD
jgi:hypothetical protein